MDRISSSDPGKIAPREKTFVPKLIVGRSCAPPSDKPLGSAI
jgi:hypothetical protein